MAHDLDEEVAAMIDADLPDAGGDVPHILQGLTQEQRAALVTYVINKIEATGIDPRAEYEEFNDDDDDDDGDDCDDDLDDDDVDPFWENDHEDDDEDE